MLTSFVCSKFDSIKLALKHDYTQTEQKRKLI